MKQKKDIKEILKSFKEKIDKLREAKMNEIKNSTEFKELREKMLNKTTEENK